jgi:hypothetical protein
MIRIITAEEPASTSITVDGQLSGGDVETVETCCEQALGKAKPVELYLRNVSSIDHAGRALLGRLAAKGVGLRAAGVYSSYVVGLISRVGLPPEPSRR